MNLVMALLSQSGSTPTVPLTASLAEQESRRLSFLPMALILMPVQLSALAVPAPRTMRVKAPSAAAAPGTFILAPFAERSERAFILWAQRDRQAKKPLRHPSRLRRPGPGPRFPSAHDLQELAGSRSRQRAERV